MCVVTIDRDSSVSQKRFNYAHEARSWLLLSGFTFDETDRHKFIHPFTGATASITTNKDGSNDEPYSD